MDPHITSEEPTSATATAPERRTSPRFVASLKVACYPVGGGFRDRRQGRIRDLSRAGIGLSLDRAIATGTVLIIELPFEQGTKCVRGRVVHSTLGMGAMYHVGCSFEGLLTDAEVQALTQ